MDFYRRMAFRLFEKISGKICYYFPEVEIDLKTARLKTSFHEYMSIALFTSFLLFIVGIPFISFILSLILGRFLFSFIAAFVTSLFLAVLAFYIFLKYPKLVVAGRSKNLEKSLPFASLYLSTISGSKLPLHETFEIFSRFSGYEDISREVDLINKDVKMFGFDINTALERAIERSPSKGFKELLWGILSTVRTGGNLSLYLKEKSKSFMQEYRRKLFEFSHTLTVYIEIYLTAIVLGAIFFTILTAIVSGIGGAPTNIIFLQTLLIFVFIPAISVVFIFLVKSSVPGGE
jgi:flagellar protein FlaJ